MSDGRDEDVREAMWLASRKLAREVDRSDGAVKDVDAIAGEAELAGDGEDDKSQRLGRRGLIGAIAGVGVGLTGTGWLITDRSATTTRGGTAPSPPGERSVGFTPAEAGGFGSADESSAAGVPGGAQVADKPPAARAVFDMPSAAASRTEVPQGSILATDDPAVHLLRRTTFGPTSELVERVNADGIDAWLEQQLEPASIPDEVADQVWAMFPLANARPEEIQGQVELRAWDAMTDLGMGVLGRQIWSERQLLEVMVDFWANHLNVTTPGGPNVWDVACAYHNDVIRGHALGSFTEMLLAAMQHPAMLRYLNNEQSTKESVNENLGRELLELHTVGVGVGYTEDDVRNSAYILTGRTAGWDEDDPVPSGSFWYDAERHWTGAVQVLEFQHENATAEGGLEVGDQYLRYLAGHPATARTIARKLAVRFVSDNPSDDLIERLADEYQQSDTAIAPVLRLLFRTGEFWAAVGQKVRRPLENMVASLRAMGVQPGGDTAGEIDHLYWRTGRGGHRPLSWPAPNGYPDVYPPWRSASGNLEIWNHHRWLARRRGEGLSHRSPVELVDGMPTGTVGELVDSLCQRLCHQTFQPAHRDAIVALTGVDAATPTGQADLESTADWLIALVLDAPYFTLR